MFSFQLGKISWISQDFVNQLLLDLNIESIILGLRHVTKHGTLSLCRFSSSYLENMMRFNMLGSTPWAPGCNRSWKLSLQFIGWESPSRRATNCRRRHPSDDEPAYWVGGVNLINMLVSVETYHYFTEGPLLNFIIHSYTAKKSLHNSTPADSINPL